MRSQTQFQSVQIRFGQLFLFGQLGQSVLGFVQLLFESLDSGQFLQGRFRLFLLYTEVFRRFPRLLDRFFRCPVPLQDSTALSVRKPSSRTAVFLRSSLVRSWVA